MKKRILILLLALLFVVLFSACDVTIDVKGDNSAIVTIECDEDDIEDWGFDPDDLEDIDDLENFYDDTYERGLDETEVEIKSFKKSGDDYTLQVRIIPAEDVDDAMDEGFAIGNAEEILDIFADYEFDDDFEDISDGDFPESLDEEWYYAWDGSGDSLDGGDFEDLYESINTSNLKCIAIEGGIETVINVPGKIKMVLAYYDEIAIEGNSVEIDGTGAYIIYSSGLGALGIILIIVAILLLAGGAVLFFILRKKKRAGRVAAAQYAPSAPVAPSAGVSKFCTNCGTQMGEQAVFCQNCGSKN